MGEVIVIKGDIKVAKVCAVFFANIGDKLFGGDAIGLSLEHNRRAVGVVGANVVALVAAHALKACPDIRLNIFDHVTKVNGAIGVGKGGSSEDFTGHG